jgi:hypothetical protein
MSLPSTDHPPQSRPLLVIAALSSALIAAAWAHGWRLAALAAIGVLLGASLHHAGFGFASGYRRLLVQRDGRGVPRSAPRCSALACNWAAAALAAPFTRSVAAVV